MRLLSLAAALTLGLPFAAQATTYTCTTAGATVSSACIGAIPGNDQDTTVGGPNVNVNAYDPDGLGPLPAGGLFGTNTWDEAARVNEPATSAGILSVAYNFPVGSGLRSGTWSVTNWVGIGSAMLVVKSSNEFIAYLLDISAGTSGSWNTAGLTNKNGVQQEVSHITLYTTPAAIPLPAAGWALLAALGGLGLVARRRRAA